jgi:hypothetical protein
LAEDIPVQMALLEYPKLDRRGDHYTHIWKVVDHKPGKKWIAFSTIIS